MLAPVCQDKQTSLPLQISIPAQQDVPQQMPSQPLDSPPSHNELCDGIWAALQSEVHKVLSEMATANQGQAGMGYNGRESVLNINIK